ncbi:unnamed protein product [Fusarium equiseti]|uniref:Uncharacterized protein n=1 Tax=Fusarium equiseti TaxID=61235 RepID=A0A8J2NGE8_FUSEQ|nr:unnamed protein product [Fusarium equiseti]
MHATIKVHITQRDTVFQIVEQGCSPKGNGSQWNDKQGNPVLSMGGDDGSGMLRFKTEQNKEAFFVAMGVRGPSPWVDIVTGLGDDVTCVQALPEYYDYYSQRSKARHIGQRELQIENIDHRLIKAEFKLSEGPDFVLDIMID